MRLLRSVPVAAVQFKVRGTFYNMNRVQDGYFTLGAVSGQVTPLGLHRWHSASRVAIL